MNLLRLVNKYIMDTKFCPWEMWGSANEVFITYKKDEGEEYRALVSSLQSTRINNPEVFKNCIFTLDPHTNSIKINKG